MNAPRINDDDRGITLSKSLAWTILLFILGIVWTGGSMLASINNRLDSLERQRTEMVAQFEERVLENRRSARDALQDHETRIRPLEAAAPLIQNRLDGIAAGIEEIKRELREDRMNTRDRLP